MPLKEIQKSFIYSLQVVEEEQQDQSKYHSLAYHEFLEFLVRMASKFYQEQTTEEEVYQFLELLFDKEGITKSAEKLSPDLDISL
jgi:hypothetical protein